MDCLSKNEQEIGKTAVTKSVYGLMLNKEDISVRLRFLAFSGQSELFWVLFLYRVQKIVITVLFRYRHGCARQV